MYVCCTSYAPVRYIGFPIRNRRCVGGSVHQRGATKKMNFQQFLKRTNSGKLFQTLSKALVKKRDARPDKSPHGLASKRWPSNRSCRIGV